MPLSFVRAHRSSLLAVLLLAASACGGESSAPVPTLTVRNDTKDTLLYLARERETAKSEELLGLLDTAAAIRTYAQAPGALRSLAATSIWGYSSGSDLRLTLFRVSGTTIAAAGYFDVTGAELALSSFFVSIPSSALMQ